VLAYHSPGKRGRLTPRAGGCWGSRTSAAT